MINDDVLRGYEQHMFIFLIFSSQFSVDGIIQP
jgi:hypothetical protein